MAVEIGHQKDEKKPGNLDIRDDEVDDDDPEQQILMKILEKMLKRYQVTEKVPQ